MVSWCILLPQNRLENFPFWFSFSKPYVPWMLNKSSVVIESAISCLCVKYNIPLAGGLKLCSLECPVWQFHLHFIIRENPNSLVIVCLCAAQNVVLVEVLRLLDKSFIDTRLQDNSSGRRRGKICSVTPPYHRHSLLM